MIGNYDTPIIVSRDWIDKSVKATLITSILFAGILLSSAVFVSPIFAAEESTGSSGQDDQQKQKQTTTAATEEKKGVGEDSDKDKYKDKAFNGVHHDKESADLEKNLRQEAYDKAVEKQQQQQQNNGDDKTTIKEDKEVKTNNKGVESGGDNYVDDGKKFIQPDNCYIGANTKCRPQSQELYEADKEVCSGEDLSHEQSAACWHKVQCLFHKIPATECHGPATKIKPNEKQQPVNKPLQTQQQQQNNTKKANSTNTTTETFKHTTKESLMAFMAMK